MKCLEHFEKIIKKLKSFRSFISKRLLHIHLNPSKNVSLVLLLNGLVIIVNGLCACNVSNKETQGKGGGGGVVALISHISFIFEYFKY